MNEIYEKMRAAIERHEQSQIKGLSSCDIVALNYSDAELIELVSKLKERPIPGDDAFRLSAFIFERQGQRISEPIRCMAADNVASYVNAVSKVMDIGAVEIFVYWGAHRADYRVTCLSLLRHANMEIREAALKCSGKFLHPSEFSHLFIFRDDSYVSEISMGGPLRYMLRDYALDILKWLTKSPVKEDDCFVDTPDGRVSYRSWSPFLNWFDKQKRQFS